MIEYAFYIAVFWWVYIHITSKPDMIMNGFYVRLDTWTQDLSKLNKLLSCEYCLAGFTSLVTYGFLFDYNFIENFIFVSLTVFIVHIFNIFLHEEH
jgi:hypothetical protein